MNGPAHPLMRLRTAEPGARRLLDAMLRRYPGNDLLAERAAGQPRRLAQRRDAP